MKADFDQALNSIKQHLKWASGDIGNNTLRDQALQRLQAVKEKYLKDRDMIAALGVPVRPVVTTGAFKPEPELLMEQYEHILEVIGNMGQVLERSPSAFATIDEEDLRMHFLVQLNGHYEGACGGLPIGRFETDRLIEGETRIVAARLEASLRRAV